jgi:hypothetical protein
LNVLCPASGRAIARDVRGGGSIRLCAYLLPRIGGRSLFLCRNKLAKPNLSESGCPDNAKLTLRKAGKSRFSQNRSLPVEMDV